MDIAHKAKTKEIINKNGACAAEKNPAPNCTSYKSLTAIVFSGVAQ